MTSETWCVPPGLTLLPGTPSKQWRVLCAAPPPSLPCFFGPKQLPSWASHGAGRGTPEPACPRARHAPMHMRPWSTCPIHVCSHMFTCTWVSTGHLYTCTWVLVHSHVCGSQVTEHTGMCVVPSSRELTNMPTHVHSIHMHTVNAFTRMHIAFTGTCVHKALTHVCTGRDNAQITWNHRACYKHMPTHV